MSSFEAITESNGFREPRVDLHYTGPLVLEAALYKNKWNATIGLLLGRFVRRFFVLDLVRFTFSYYSDESKTNVSQQYSINVSASGVILVGDNRGH